MKKIIAGLAFATLSLSAQSGEITLTGTGCYEKHAEFIEVGIEVQSECFKKPREAMADNDAKVSEIQKFLKPLLLNNHHDKVSTQGGTTQPFSREKILGGHERATECEGTFQKTTHITFRTSDVDEKSFSEKFLQLQEMVLSTFSSQGEGETPRTFASISQPRPGVSKESRKQMALEALKLAQRNAREQFDALAMECKIQGPVSVTHKNNEHHNDYYGASSAPKSMSLMPAGERSFVALDFEPLKVTKTLPVTFHYQSPSFMCEWAR